MVQLCCKTVGMTIKVSFLIRKQTNYIQTNKKKRKNRNEKTTKRKLSLLNELAM